MVQYVRPNVLGTRSEFANRFMNPITAGQTKEATPRDVRRMQNQSYVLHRHLSATIHRRDLGEGDQGSACRHVATETGICDQHETQ